MKRGIQISLCFNIKLPFFFSFDLYCLFILLTVLFSSYMQHFEKLEVKVTPKSICIKEESGSVKTHTFVSRLMKGLARNLPWAKVKVEEI